MRRHVKSGWHKEMNKTTTTKKKKRWPECQLLHMTRITIWWVCHFKKENLSAIPQVLLVFSPPFIFWWVPACRYYMTAHNAIKSNKLFWIFHVILCMLCDYELGGTQQNLNLLQTKQERNVHLKALKEMIQLLWSKVPCQFCQQVMDILHNSIMFPWLRHVEVNKQMYSGVSFLFSHNNNMSAICLLPRTTEMTK